MLKKQVKFTDANWTYTKLFSPRELWCIMYEDANLFRKSLWDRYYVLMPEQLKAVRRDL